MSDIFLSYASADKSRVEVVARALQSLGYSVWWDVEIPAGQRFERVIQGALESAKAVIVLWTNTSVNSEWVYEEADFGKRKNTLVPILLEDCTPPLGFRVRECAQLAGFNGDVENREWQNLLKSLESLVDPRAGPQALHATPEASAAQAASESNDLRYDLSLSLEQAFSGIAEQLVEFTLPHPNGREERRTLKAQIPAGVEDGTRIRLTGEGLHGPDGRRGDLYLFLSIAAHPVFERAGADLHARWSISFPTATLGGHLQCPTIDGRQVKITIPAGTQSGRRFRVPQYGMSQLKSTQRGDLLVEVFVETPTNLSGDAKRCVERLRDLIK